MMFEGANLYSLVEDAERALDNLIKQETQLIRDTENLFKEQVNLMKHFDDLRDHIPKVDIIKSDMRRLASLVDSCMVVEDVCSRFKLGDRVKLRLEDSLAQINDIINLKLCQKGMLNAMESNNHEEAAMHIKCYLSIDKAKLQKTIPIIGGESQLLLAMRDLDEARRRLLFLCHKNMAKAIQDRHTKDIERYFKIFPMLNEHQDGLQVYSEYLREKVVDEHSDATLKSKDINQAGKLAALFESVAKLIDLHQPLIETYYGPGYLIYVVKFIQKECDRLSRKVLEEFRNETNLQQISRIVRNSSSQTISNKLDLKSLDKILDEISLIVSRSEVYLGFLVQRIENDIQSISDDRSLRDTAQSELNKLMLYECELNHLCQELGGIYVMFEQYYLNESSKKAISIDQIEIDTSCSCLISSMLDDIFFIINKCTRRAVSTKSTEVFCAIINHCVALLESTFCKVLEDRLRSYQYYAGQISIKKLDLSHAYNVIQSGYYLQSATDQEKQNSNYFSALNNLDKACDYIKTLRGNLNSDVKKLASKHHNRLDKPLACLDELEQLTRVFKAIIESALHKLFNLSLKTRVKVGLESVVEENPDLVPIVSSDPNELSILASDLLSRIDCYLEKSLMTGNYLKLVSITSDYLASTIK